MKLLRFDGVLHLSSVLALVCFFTSLWLLFCGCVFISFSEVAFHVLAAVEMPRAASRYGAASGCVAVFRSLEPSNERWIHSANVASSTWGGEILGHEDFQRTVCKVAETRAPCSFPRIPVTQWIN